MKNNKNLCNTCKTFCCHLIFTKKPHDPVARAKKLFYYSACAFYNESENESERDFPVREEEENWKIVV